MNKVVYWLENFLQMALNVEKMLEWIERQRLVQRGQPVLVSVSGGVDSVVLLHLLVESGAFSLGVAHCNFGLRGEESDADQEFVRQLAEKFSLPFFSVRFDTKAYARRHSLSIQEAARQLRYNWLEEVRRREGYHRIATGHTLSDQLETLLLAIVRGGYWRSLGGIQPRWGKVIRPLLFATREKVEEYARTRGLQWREDTSNLLSVYERNFIRHHVVPLLKELNPSVEETAGRLSVQVRQVQAVYDVAVQEFLSRVVVEEGGVWRVPWRLLVFHSASDVLIFEFIRQFGFGWGDVERVRQLALCSQTGRYVDSPHYRIVKDRNWLVVVPVGEEQEQVAVLGVEQTRAVFPDGVITLEVRPAGEVNVSASSLEAFLDASRLSLPLLVRRWRPGDYFYPLGLNKKKKIKKFITDEKVPAHKKKNVLVVCSGDKIVWVVGYRIDHRFRVEDSTTQVCILRWTPTEGGAFC